MKKVYIINISDIYLNVNKKVTLSRSNFKNKRKEVNCVVNVAIKIKMILL